MQNDCKFGKTKFRLGSLGALIRTYGIRKRIRNNNTFEGNNFIGEGSELYACQVGKMTYVSCRTFLSYVKIGRYCSIGPDVSIIVGEHPTSEFVSTSPAFFDKEHEAVPCLVQNNKYDEIRFTDESKRWYAEIGNDVWIGAGAKILGGNKIGNGAIIAAGSLVNKDVPSYAIVGGVPAKIIKYRFNEEDRNWLEKFKWWDKSDEWIKDYAESFENIARFRKQIYENEKSNDV